MYAHHTKQITSRKEALNALRLKLASEATIHIFRDYLHIIFAKKHKKIQVLLTHSRTLHDNSIFIVKKNEDQFSNENASKSFRKKSFETTEDHHQ